MQDVEKIASVAGQTIDCDHNEGIPFTEGLERAAQLWALGCRSAHLLLENTLGRDAGSVELRHLCGEVLRPGRDSRVAVDHAAISEQNFGALNLLISLAAPSVPNVLIFGTQACRFSAAEPWKPTMRPDLRAILDRDENKASSLHVLASFVDPADQHQCVETLYRSDEGRYFLLVDRALIAVTLATVFLWFESRGMPELTVWVGLELEKLEVEAATRGDYDT